MDKIIKEICKRVFKLKKQHKIYVGKELYDFMLEKCFHLPRNEFRELFISGHSVEFEHTLRKKEYKIEPLLKEIPLRKLKIKTP